jgi:hypothetical protein
MANGCDEFEDTIGDYNYYTLDLLDATIVKIAKNGMKALISPHNANLLSTDGGYTKDVYGNTWGSGDSEFPRIFSDNRGLMSNSVYIAGRCQSL